MGPGSNSRPLDQQSDTYLQSGTLPMALRGLVPSIYTTDMSSENSNLTSGLKLSLLLQCVYEKRDGSRTVRMCRFL